MKLKKFRIYNYKSIQDSGDCEFASDFTILVGKNESGKTAILEALRDFDREEYAIPEAAVPLSGSGEPLLELTFELTPKELDTIIQESQLKIPDEQRWQILEHNICLRKTYAGEYYLKNEYVDTLFNESGPETQSDINQIKIKKQKLDELLKGFPTPELKLDQGNEILENSIRDIRSSVKSRLNLIPEEGKKVELVELLRDITRLVSGSDPQRVRLTSKARLTNALVQRLPRFVFFSDFKDVLPSEVTLDSLKENPIVADFAQLANLDLNTILKTEDLQKRINLLNRFSAEISGDFMEHWEQSKAELVIRPDGNKLFFGVKEVEGTDVYKLSQRSKGFQWFLSFYLRLNRFKDDNAVVLVDEPGTNLHPVAQEDILKIFAEKSTGDIQIVFSTHSSGLIDAQRLNRVRFVVKSKEKGTTIKESINTGVDHQTLMPVMAALSAQFPADFTFSEKLDEILPIKEEPASPIPQTAVKEELKPQETPAESQAMKSVEEIKEKTEETEEDEEDIPQSAPRRSLMSRLFGARKEVYNEPAEDEEEEESKK